VNRIESAELLVVFLLIVIAVVVAGLVRRR